MAEWLEKISSWWGSRSRQEQRTLKIALPIICLMVIYLVLVEPIMGLYFSRKSEYNQAEDDLTWLYEQSSLVARMQNNCGSRIFYLQDGEAPQDLALTIARRSSINASLQTVGEAVAITVDTVPGNRMLAYVQTLACSGFQIERLEIKRLASAPDAVSATLNALPMALPRAVQ